MHAPICHLLNLPKERSRGKIPGQLLNLSTDERNTLTIQCHQGSLSNALIQQN